MWCTTAKTADGSGVVTPESPANPALSHGLRLGWVGASEGLPALAHALAGAGAAHGAVELAARYPTLEAFGSASRRQTAIQVLLVDLDLTPDALPIASSSLSRMARDIPVVVVTSTVDAGLLAELMAAGVCGLCARQDATATGLATAIQSAVTGGLYFSRTFAPQAIGLLRWAHKFRTEPTLSRSEKELLDYLAKAPLARALPVKQVAEKLGKSPQTIRNRLTTICKKLGGMSRKEVVEWWRDSSRPERQQECYTGT